MTLWVIPAIKDYKGDNHAKTVSKAEADKSDTVVVTSGTNKVTISCTKNTSTVVVNGKKVVCNGR
jgi:hypothetical protein